VRFLYGTADGKDSPPSIARVDRTARKVDICRTFVWMIAVIVAPADERLPTAYRPCNNPAVCSSFVLYPTLAVGAVGILTSFTMI
jgi:hypothetical protein